MSQFVPKSAGPFQLSKGHSYYWIAKTPNNVPGLPLNLAQELYKAHGQIIRAGGHGLGPEPETQVQRPYSLTKLWNLEGTKE